MIGKFFLYLRGQLLLVAWIVKTSISCLKNRTPGCKIHLDESLIKEFVDRVLKKKFGWSPALTAQVVSPIWSDIASQQWMDVLKALEGRGSLAAIYSNFLNTPMVIGIEDNLSTGEVIKPKDLYYTFRFVVQLLNYAKSRGYITQNFFHQPSTALLPSELDALLDKFAVRVDRAGFDAFRAFSINGSRIPTDLADCKYFADFIDAVLAIKGIRRNAVSFCELGGGSGLFASEFFSRDENAQYIFADLVPFLVWQSVLFEDKCDYLPAECVENWSGRVDVLINQDSFPEIPVDILRNYINAFISMGVKHVFSYNQGSQLRGQSDHVRVLLDAGFELLLCHGSVVRKGYRLEYYRMQGAD